MESIFIISFLILGYIISFILSIYFYAFMIHKKEKKFTLSSYSKWSIIITNTMVFGMPILMLIDLFKNNFMAEIKFKIKFTIFYLFIFWCIIFMNNILLQFVYQVKFILKLSDKMKSIGNFFLNSLNQKYLDLASS
jgi:biotin transporter BioY